MLHISECVIRPYLGKKFTARHDSSRGRIILKVRDAACLPGCLLRTSTLCVIIVQPLNHSKEARPSQERKRGKIYSRMVPARHKSMNALMMGRLCQTTAVAISVVYASPHLDICVQALETRRPRADDALTTPGRALPFPLEIDAMQSCSHLCHAPHIVAPQPSSAPYSFGALNIPPAAYTPTLKVCSLHSNVWFTMCIASYN